MNHTIICICGFQTLVVLNREGNVIKEVKVIDVDTISQVKEKILDALHLNKPYSSRPSANQVSLGKLLLNCSVKTRHCLPLFDIHQFGDSVSNNFQKGIFILKFQLTPLNVSHTTLIFDQRAFWSNTPAENNQL